MSSSTANRPAFRCLYKRFSITGQKGADPRPKQGQRTCTRGHSLGGGRFMPGLSAFFPVPWHRSFRVLCCCASWNVPGPGLCSIAARSSPAAIQGGLERGSGSFASLSRKAYQEILDMDPKKPENSAPFITLRSNMLPCLSCLVRCNQILKIEAVRSTSQWATPMTIACQ